MTELATSRGYAVYWRTWAFLLLLTVLMFFVDRLDMPALPFALIMVTAMLVKAGLIAGIFMHLRHEAVDLAAAIAVAILGCGVVLYVLIAPDALRIAAMGAR